MTAAIEVYETAKREDERITGVRKKAIADAEAGKSGAAGTALLDQFTDPAVNQSCARLVLLGMAQQQIGDWTGARPTWERLLALAVDEYLPEAYTDLSLELRLYMGDYDKVLCDSDTALQTYSDSPATPSIMFYRARSYDLLGHMDNCIQAYESLVSRFSNVQEANKREIMATALARLGNRLSSVGRTTEARTYLQRAVDEYPETGYAQSAANSLRDLTTSGGR